MNDDLRKKIKSEVLIRYSPCDVKERIAFQEGAEAMHSILKPEIESKNKSIETLDRLFKEQSAETEARDNRIDVLEYSLKVTGDDSMCKSLKISDLKVKTEKLEARLKIACAAIERVLSKDTDVDSFCEETCDELHDALLLIRELDAKEKSNDKKES